jgi:hypothetical protein
MSARPTPAANPWLALRAGGAGTFQEGAELALETWVGGI